jgi:hypothetical protein
VVRGANATTVGSGKDSGSESIIPAIYLEYTPIEEMIQDDFCAVAIKK